MKRALRKEMESVRKGMLSEKDRETRILMASMYRELYGQAFRDEEAERPMRLTRAFVRSIVVYFLVGMAVLAGLGYLFGAAIVYVAGALMVAALVMFSVISMRTTKTISEDTFKDIVGRAFEFISANNPGKAENSDQRTALYTASQPALIKAGADLQLPPEINEEDLYDDSMPSSDN